MTFLREFNSEPWRVSVGFFQQVAVDHRSLSLALGARIEWAPWVIEAYIR